jgi:hypothetical protein
MIVQDTGVTDCRITAIESGAAINNHGLVFRYTDEDNYLSLVQSVTYGNWVLRSTVDNSVVFTKTIVGPHVDGTVVDVVLSGTQVFVYFDGQESASSPTTIETNQNGTYAGIRAGDAGTTYWSEFRAGVYNTAFDGQLYLDTELSQLWGPYNAETETFPGPTALISPTTILDKIKTVDGSGSALDADLLDGYEATDLIPAKRTFYAGELAASRPTTAITTQASIGVRSAYWGLVNAADHGVVFGMTIPEGWDTIHVDVKWAPSSTDTGDVRWEASRVVAADGGNITSWGVAVVGTSDAADGVASIVQTTRVLTSIDVTPGDELFFHVERNGDDAADTFTGDVRLMSVQVIKAS